ncbi:glycosyl hydrolase family 18 protein [soil metagenome]
MRPVLLTFMTMLLLSAAAAARPLVVAYVPNWIDLAAFTETIDYDKVTHLNIAFENPINDEGELSFNKENDVLIAKAKDHQVKILISIGGGSASGDKVLLKRYARLLEAEHRADFVARLAAYVTTHQFDGLDVDLEGPSITADYGAFISDLATALKPFGKLLTAALSKGYGGDKVPATIFDPIDFINIMAYDATGPWQPQTPGQHSSLDFARENIAWWLARGLPRNKAVLGVPFYGYGFGKAFRKGDYPYKDIVENYEHAENADETGSTIWYNGIPTIKAKAREVVEQGLAGIMIWSLDADTKDKRSLLTAIHETLKISLPKKP